MLKYEDQAFMALMRELYTKLSCDEKQRIQSMQLDLLEVDWAISKTDFNARYCWMRAVYEFIMSRPHGELKSRVDNIPEVLVGCDKIERKVSERGPVHETISRHSGKQKLRRLRTLRTRTS